MVPPDRQGMARGTLYLDDGKTFDYKQGRKIYIEITWDNGKLESKIIESGAHFVQICQFSLLFQVLTLPFGWRRFWCWEQNQALVLRR